MIDVLDSTEIFSLLDGECNSFYKIEVLDKTESTNVLLRSRAAFGAQEGTVIIAGEQSGGKGRMGRSFFSPGNTGVYMSVLLKPQIVPEDAVQITTAAAVAVCRALERCGVYDSQIKWVNDVFIRGKKVCGILTEASFNSRSNSLDYAVLGVGINIYVPEQGFPEDIKTVAGAVFENPQQGLRNRFVAAFLEEFFAFYKEFSSKKYLDEYRKRNFVLGKKVYIIQNGKRELGKAVEIDDKCNLTAELEDGTLKKLYFGEISLQLD